MKNGVQIPHWGWWVAILGGMGLTAWIGFTPAGYAFWCGQITERLPQVMFQWIFWLASAVHVLEALYAFYIARRNGIRQATGWSVQTLLLGFASLHLLKQRVRHEGNTP